MRWERTAGLPVRRVAGGRGRSVFAYKVDIDDWLASRPALSDGGVEPMLAESPAAQAAPSAVRPRFGTRALLAAAALVAGLAAVVLLAQWWRAPVLAKAALVGEEIVAFDASGREAWRHRLPHIDGAIVPARLMVADVDEDGRPEVLAALHFMAHSGHRPGVVMLLDGRGRPRWERALDDRYRFGDQEYGPPWYPEDILIYRSNGSARIAVAQHHHTWWPGIVVTYDADGRTIDRFVNAGWIRTLNMTPDGRHLLAAGISNDFGGAALAVLDPASPGGTSPGDGLLPACANCPSGRPVAYFVAPWSALGRASDTPNAVVQVDDGGGIEWHAIQRAEDGGKAPEVIIGLSPRLEFVRWGVNNYFTELQKAAEPMALRQWTPSRGWRDIASQ